MKTAVQIISICGIAVLLSGCACTEYVKGVGRSNVHVVAGDAFMEPSGNLYVEAEFLRRPRNRKKGGRFQGHRVIILNAPGIERAAREQLDKQGYDDISPDYARQINITFRRSFYRPSDDAEAEMQTQWYLYPADTIRKHEELKLPSHLRKAKWQLIPKVSGQYTMPVMVDGVLFEVHFNLVTRTVHSKDALWGRPVRALLWVPAFVVDVVTFPIQFGRIVYELNQINW